VSVLDCARFSLIPVLICCCCWCWWWWWGWGWGWWALRV